MPNNYSKIMMTLSNSIRTVEKNNLNIKNAVKEFNKNKCENDPCASYVWIKKNENLISDLFPEFHQLIENLYELCNDTIFKLESNLKEALSVADLSFDGNWPNYIINKILPLYVDDKRLEITIGKTKINNFSINILLSTIKMELEYITIDKKYLSYFLSDLFKSYCDLSNEKYSSVSVYEVYKQMIINKQSPSFWRNASKAKYKPFEQLQFKAYLTEVLKSNLTKVENYQLRLLPPLSNKDSIYIFQPTENRFVHVGRIEFLLDEVNEDE